MTNKIIWHVSFHKEDLLTNDRPSLTCPNQDTVEVTYYIAPDPQFTIIPRTAAGCTPFTAQFANMTVNDDTTGSVFYRWNFGNITSFDTDDHDSIISKTFYNDQDYDSIVPIWLTTGLKIPGGKTCYNTDSSEIIVYAVPKAVLNAHPKLQTQPSTNVNLNAAKIDDDNTRYTFDYGDGGGSVWEDNSQYQNTLVHEYATYGVYKIALEVKNMHCSSSDTQEITILPSPPIREMKSTGYEGCEPMLHEMLEKVKYADSIRWDIYCVSDTTVLPAHEYYKSGDAATHLFEKPGRYLLYQYAYGPGAVGEKYMRTDTVMVYPSPTVAFTAHPDTVRLPNIPLFTENLSQGAVEWTWDFGDGTTDEHEIKAFEPTHYYETAGDYYVTLTATTDHRCSATSPEVYVRVEPEGMLRFPNAFRPDPSGPCGGIETKFHNYVFLPYPRHGVQKGTYILEIFNRYGEKIFESNDPDIGWDGYYRGELCKQDVYVFKARCTFENGKLFKQIGNVTLLR